jgi:hypothetical protein
MLLYKNIKVLTDILSNPNATPAVSLMADIDDPNSTYLIVNMTELLPPVFHPI